jgi:hypothetical protein
MNGPVLYAVLGLVVLLALGLFLRAALRGGEAIRQHGDQRSQRFRAEQRSEKLAAAAAAPAALSTPGSTPVSTPVRDEAWR